EAPTLYWNWQHNPEAQIHIHTEGGATKTDFVLPLNKILAIHELPRESTSETNDFPTAIHPQAHWVIRVPRGLPLDLSTAHRITIQSMTDSKGPVPLAESPKNDSVATVRLEGPKTPVAIRHPLRGEDLHEQEKALQAFGKYLTSRIQEATTL